MCKATCNLTIVITKWPAVNRICETWTLNRLWARYAQLLWNLFDLQDFEKIWWMPRDNRFGWNSNSNDILCMLEQLWILWQFEWGWKISKWFNLFLLTKHIFTLIKWQNCKVSYFLHNCARYIFLLPWTVVLAVRDLYLLRLTGGSCYQQFVPKLIALMRIWG